MSLANTDLNIFLKALAVKLKSVLSSLASQQTVYVQNRYTGEGGTLISDILGISDKLNLDAYSVTVDIEKAFDSLDHQFLVLVFKKVGFGNTCFFYKRRLF